MSDKIRKYVLPNLPYLFVFWFFSKIGTAYRIAPDTDFGTKLMGMLDTFPKAFETYWPGLGGIDLLVGLAGAAGVYLLIQSKIRQGLFLGMPSQPDGKGGYRDMAYPVTKEFREQLNTAVLQAYEAKLEQMAERGSVGRASISDQLKAGKAAAEQAKAERPPKEKPSRSAER